MRQINREPTLVPYDYMREEREARLNRVNRLFYGALGVLGVSFAGSLAYSWAEDVVREQQQRQHIINELSSLDGMHTELEQTIGMVIERFTEGRVRIGFCSDMEGYDDYR